VRRGWLLTLIVVLLLLVPLGIVPVGKYAWRGPVQEGDGGPKARSGFRIVLKARTEGLSDEDWRMKRLSLPGILERRLQGAFHEAEAYVGREGPDRFSVEISGVQNSKEVIDVLCTTAHLEFWHPLNVQTERDTGRQYKPVERQTEAGTSEYDIRDATAGLEVEPVIYRSGTDELYKFMESNWELILTGEMLEDAKATQTSGRPVIALRFNEDGAQRLYDFSRKVEGLAEVLAIVIDKHIVSFPKMMAVIENGEAVIEGGGMTGEEAVRLAALLQAGALPVDLEVVSVEKLEPTHSP
jgi:preprotein translocase subunit SecD